MILRWLRAYSSSLALRDITAALIAVPLLLPQNLAYAQIAGLPPVAGLYASILPAVAYAMLGSSSTLAVGPFALTSLMTANALSGLALVGSAHYSELALDLAALVGVILVLAGILRLGVLANLLSQPIIAGFTTGAAIIIAVDQLKPLLGIESHARWSEVLLQPLQILTPTAVLGVGALSILVLCRLYLKRMLCFIGIRDSHADLVTRAAPLIVLAVCTSLIARFDWSSRYAIAVIGQVTSGLPAFALHVPDKLDIQRLVVPAILIAVTGFASSVSVARTLGAIRNEKVEPNHELQGLGVANLAAACSGGFPVSGGLSRSAVFASSGAQTPIAGAFAGAIMAVLVTQLAGLLTHMPISVLAAAVIVPVLGLMDLRTLLAAWKYSPADAWAYLGTFAGVLVSGVNSGLGLGIVISVGTLLWRASRPHIAEVGRVPGTEHYRNILRATVDTHPGMVILRIDGDLFFANIDAIEVALNAVLRKRAPVHDLVLDFSAVNHIDLTGLERLQALNQRCFVKGIRLHLAEVKGPLLDQLQHSTLLRDLAHPVFRFTHDAVSAVIAER